MYALPIITVVAVGFFFGFVTDREIILRTHPEIYQAAIQTAETSTVSIMLDFENGDIRTLYNLPVGQNEHLLPLLARALKKENTEIKTKEYSGLGTLVVKIGNKENGGGNAYWQYWVNNRHAEVGADQYVVKPDDVIEWKFTTSGE